MLSIILGAILLAYLPSAAQAEVEAYWDYLLKPQAVAAVLAEEPVQLVDIRGVASGFERGHIEGSVSLSFGRFRGSNDARGIPPSAADLSAMAGAAGLLTDRRTLIIHSGLDENSFAAAAWVYWVLKSNGFSQLAVMDGGIRAWKKAGLPVTRAAVVPLPTEVTLAFSNEWLATTEDVARIAEGETQGTLIDSRADAVKDTQTISGALSYAMTALMEPSHQEALEPVEMLEKLKYSGVEWEQHNVVTFCNDGLQGAAAWFMASEVAGIGQVKLYAESLQGWSNQ
ncbi:MAG: rhodanese-like domain-containing protein [Pseudomonadota bacterium]